MHSAVYLLDVAHPPRPADTIETQLLEAWQMVRNSPTLRVMKVIHGYGSSGKGGSSRETVRNWAFQRKSRLRAVIDGEHYSVRNRVIEELLKDVGPLGDPDLDAGNPGITILWVR